MISDLGDRRPVLEGDTHFVADSADVIGDVCLKDESSVWFQAVLRGDNDRITIGERSNVQDGAILHVDPGFPLTVGDGVTIGHKVMLHGCTIGDNSLIGINSVILNGARIGKNCVVGAQSLVTENKEFPDNSLILGSPATVARVLSDDEVAMIGKSAAAYVRNAERYRNELGGR
ncbi:MAG: gamma carbonic anhydrase family protein [Woeseiaceae bacterium]|nr:gamma carbonic anhydrase family protein [Woeseiaceae bacterium]